MKIPRLTAEHATGRAIGVYATTSTGTQAVSGVRMMALTTVTDVNQMINIKNGTAPNNCPQGLVPCFREKDFWNQYECCATDDCYALSDTIGKPFCGAKTRVALEALQPHNLPGDLITQYLQ